MWKSSSANLISEGSESSVDSISISSSVSSMSQMPTHDMSGGGCHMLGRKKRRGMIEKRRRDRINNSLNELRRLVPAAFEKQGSAKLEKAEILQMTVDHLTMLHAKGFDAFSFDPHKFAMDYHSLGFRECASECARYMVTVEGMDLQDPLRLRLMSHLQCYAAQRELSLKSTSSVWNPSAFTAPTHQFSVPPPPPAPHSIHWDTPKNNNHHHMSSSNESSWSHSVASSGDPSSVHMMPPPPIFKSSSPPPPVSSQSLMYPPSGHQTPSQAPSGHHQYFPPPPPGSYGTHPSGPSGQIPTSGSVKHYRPWGAELAY